MTSAPLVGIGLPTHNGERFIAEAIESLLAQEHDDIEIVVSDNASTDGTPDIIREFVRRDSRIRHERVELLMSAPHNFNRAFALSQGRYFMWAADDDLWHPSYVRRCLAALDEDPTAVMASSGLRFIDPAGEVINANYSRYDNPDLSSRSVVERVRRVLRRGGWYQVYGLARREALQQTHLFREVYGPDVVLVLELAMLGPVIRIPETLFWYRRFPGRTEAARAERQGGIPDEAQVLTAPTTHLQEALSDAVRSSALPRPMKLRLLGEIIRAAYIDDTPIRSRTRREAWIRAKSAARERDLGRFLKFTVARLVAQRDAIPRAMRSWLTRAIRLARRTWRRART